jgi:hypothetical protein
METFELKHDNGKLIAVVKINGIIYEKDVTQQFEKENAHDDWLDHKLRIKYS